MDTNKITLFKCLIEELNNQYKDNEYIISRLETHLANLPNVLEQENKKNIDRINRFNELTNELDKFSKIFLTNNQYYYICGTFFEYDGKCYKKISEDNILYNILNTLSTEDDSKLNPWKHKAKLYIMKKIKERSLLTSTPETHTIQNVISFFYAYFKTKTEIKYFLTVMGDCIFKKNESNIYFVSSNFKNFISLFDSIIYSIVGTSIMSNFTTKYHENHKLTNYKIINTRENDINIIKEIIFNIGIDIICVASHYSERYSDSNNYLNNKKDELKLVSYFTNITIENIVDDFLSQSVEQSNQHNITWKNMHYIWKSYLASINIPNVIYSNSLLNILKTKLENITDNNDNVIFSNVTSKYLPKIKTFLDFWDEYIISDQDDNYEVDEILVLYKQTDKKINLSEKDIIYIVKHYFQPNVSIIDDKYITNIKCNLWDKNKDIYDFIEHFKTNNEIKDDIISFDDLYNHYKSFKKIYPKSLIISKKYFENFLINNIEPEYIQFNNKFVSSKIF
jgi:hypothetical protein